MDVSTPPKLRPRLSLSGSRYRKYVHMFRNRGVDKNKIRTLGHHDNSYNSNMYRF